MKTFRKLHSLLKEECISISSPSEYTQDKNIFLRIYLWLCTFEEASKSHEKKIQRTSCGWVEPNLVTDGPYYVKFGGNGSYVWKVTNLLLSPKRIFIGNFLGVKNVFLSIHEDEQVLFSWLSHFLKSSNYLVLGLFKVLVRAGALFGKMFSVFVSL